MTNTTTPAMTHRTYTRVAGEVEERITVNIGPDGRVRMTAQSLHQLLSALGFTDINQETT